MSEIGLYDDGDVRSRAARVKERAERGWREARERFGGAGGMRAATALAAADSYRRGVSDMLWEVLGRDDPQARLAFRFIPNDWECMRRLGCNLVSDSADAVNAIAVLTGKTFEEIFLLVKDLEGIQRGPFSCEPFREIMLPGLGIEGLFIPRDERVSAIEAHRRYGDGIYKFVSDDGMWLWTRYVAIIGGEIRAERDFLFGRDGNCGWRAGGEVPGGEPMAVAVYRRKRDTRPRLLLVDYIYDDGGRAAAGFRGKPQGDCAVRAAAIAAGAPYRQVYRAMSEVNNAARLSVGLDKAPPSEGVSLAAAKMEFASFGLVKSELPGKYRFTLTEAYNELGDLLAITRGGAHAVAVVDGAARDIWDSRFKEDGSEEEYADEIYVPKGRLL